MSDKKMQDEREREFFEWFAKIQELADKHEVSVYTVANARQIWDMAYTSGVAYALKEQLAKQQA